MFVSTSAMTGGGSRLHPRMLETARRLVLERRKSAHCLASVSVVGSSPKRTLSQRLSFKSMLQVPSFSSSMFPPNKNSSSVGIESGTVGEGSDTLEDVDGCGSGRWGGGGGGAGMAEVLGGGRAVGKGCTRHMRATTVVGDREVEVAAAVMSAGVGPQNPNPEVEG